MWKPKDIGQIIAERELEFKNDDTGSKKIFLRIGQPVRSSAPEDGDPWWCPILIEGFGGTKFQAIAGEDSLQCLLLALKYAKKILPEYAKEQGGQIYWLTEDMDSIFDQQNMIDSYSMIIAEAFKVLREAARKLRKSKSGDMQDTLIQIEQLLHKYNADGK